MAGNEVVERPAAAAKPSETPVYVETHHSSMPPCMDYIPEPFKRLWNAWNYKGPPVDEGAPTRKLHM
jgi:hypothetical protein